MRLPRHLRTLLFTGLLTGPGFVTLPTLQVLGVRILTPRLTLTMTDRAYHAASVGHPIRIRSQLLRLEDAGQLPRLIISSEDGQFYLHHGFDREGICAAWDSNQRGGRLRGGSTLSQQTARNLFLVQKRSWLRKGLEVGYTVLLEVLLPKNRILELYINIAETGSERFGFQEAAHFWYDRDAAELTTDQAARLVYLLPNPRERSPKSRAARQKAQWIHKNRAPLPGEDGFDRQVERWRSRPWWPLCD